MNPIYRVFLVLLIPLLACASVKSQKSVDKKEVEYIDFDALRIQFPKFSVDSIRAKSSGIENDSVFLVDSGYFMSDNQLSDSLKVLMDTLSAINKSVPYYGYRIVLYTGSDRQKAIFERGKALKILGESKTEVYMNYQQPYFKVKVGNFYNRVSAYKTYLTLKKSIPTALLVPDIIDLNKVEF